MATLRRAILASEYPKEATVLSVAGRIAIVRIGHKRGHIQMRVRLAAGVVPDVGDTVLLTRAGDEVIASAITRKTQVQADDDVLPPRPISQVPTEGSVAGTDDDVLRVGSVAGGDLDGTYPNPSVIALRGLPITPASPNDQDVLTWDATSGELIYAPQSGGTPATGGDLSGPVNNAEVVGLRGQPISPTTPVSGNVYRYDGAQWTPVTLQASDVGAASDVDLQNHINDTNNPHNVTTAQIGAATDADLQNHVNDTNNPHNVTAAQIGAATSTDLQNHINDTNNPHNVTAAQVGAAPSVHASQHSQTGSDPISPADIGAATAADLQNHISNTNNPHNVTAAQTGAAPLTHASQHGRSGSDPVALMDMRGFMVKNLYNTTQTFTQASVWTKIDAVWDDIIYNSDGWFDSTNARFSASESGLYMVGAFITLEYLSIDKKLIVALYKNGTFFTTLGRGVTPVQDTFGTGGSTIMFLSPGDYVEVYIYCNDTTLPPTHYRAGYCSFWGLKMETIA